MGHRESSMGHSDKRLGFKWLQQFLGFLLNFWFMPVFVDVSITIRRLIVML